MTPGVLLRVKANTKTLVSRKDEKVVSSRVSTWVGDRFGAPATVSKLRPKQNLQTKMKSLVKVVFIIYFNFK